MAAFLAGCLVWDRHILGPCQTQVRRERGPSNTCRCASDLCKVESAIRGQRLCRKCAGEVQQGCFADDWWVRAGAREAALCNRKANSGHSTPTVSVCTKHNGHRARLCSACAAGAVYPSAGSPDERAISTQWTGYVVGPLPDNGSTTTHSAAHC